MSEEVKQEGSFKVSKRKSQGKAKNLGKIDNITKVDLNAEKKQIEADKAPTKVTVPSTDSKVEEKKEEVKKEEVKVENILEEVIEKKEEIKEVVEEEVEVIKEKSVEKLVNETKEAVRDEKVLGKPLPENIEKLVSFMDETGGTVEDYVALNKPYHEYNDDDVIKEYYKKTRPHLNDEEVRFIMEDNFSYDEEADEERFVRKQKLAHKEEVAKAKNFLEQMKGKYYDEIKLRPSVTNEQKKAMDFFQRYNKEQSTIADKRSEFINKTRNYFQDEFEGFNFDVGEKKFKYKLSNNNDIIEGQTDVGKFINKFMDKDGSISDLQGYHKAIYTAKNSDRIAQHFYEQGKADATKEIIAKSKNITTDSRPVNTSESTTGNWKARSLSTVDETKLKIKRKNINK